MAIQLEERDLVDAFGSVYASYKRQVPMLVPGFSRRSREGAEATLVDAR